MTTSISGREPMPAGSRRNKTSLLSRRQIRKISIYLHARQNSPRIAKLHPKKRNFFRRRSSCGMSNIADSGVLDTFWYFVVGDTEAIDSELSVIKLINQTTRRGARALRLLTHDIFVRILVAPITITVLKIDVHLADSMAVHAKVSD